MFLSSSSAKRLCLRAMLLCGQPFASLCEVSPPGHAGTDLRALGTPTTQASITSIITITTTIAYKPSLIPGNSRYTLVGCYSSPESEGNIFGADEIIAGTDKVQLKNLTIDSCLGACDLATPPGNGPPGYNYAGLKNGSECICGTQLSADVHKLSASDCKVPCPGDARLSCGGQENVAVYGLISNNAAHTQQLPLNSNSSSLSSSSTRIITKVKPTISTSSKPSTVATGSQTTISKAANSDTTQSPSPGPAAPRKTVSTPTIAAIAGSFSGAIIIGAGLFICYRAKKRKQVQSATIKTMLDRRPTSSPIFGGADILNNVTNTTITRDRSERAGSWDHGTVGGGSSADVEKSNKPIFRSNQYPVDLHVHTTTATGMTLRTGKSREFDGLYNSLMEEVCTSPADAQIDTGASSAVEWRPNSSLPSSPYAAHHRKVSSSGFAMLSPSTDVNKPFGEHAWNQRKPYSQYQSPQGIGKGVVTAGMLDARSGKGRGNIAIPGPASSPPTIPLPPTPSFPSKMMERSHSKSPSLLETRPNDQDNEGEFSAKRPPMRPRRSLNALDFEVGSPHHSEPDVAPASQMGLSLSERRALGMSHLNASTPSLGRFGSISSSRRTTVESLIESPILGWKLQWSKPSRPGDGPGIVLERQPATTVPQTPVLPPIAPGERFDHKRWKDTIYDDPSRDSEYEWNEKRRHNSNSDIPSPVSVSSVGTSILYTSQEFDRQL